MGGGPDELTPKVNNSNFFNIAGLIVLRGAIALAKTMPTLRDDREVRQWQRALDEMVIPMNADGVIKPFDAAPDNLTLAVPANWSLGSLQYLLPFGLPARLVSNVKNTFTAEEILRHRFPANPSVGCSETLHNSDASEWFICAPFAPVPSLLGNRGEALAI